MSNRESIKSYELKMFQKGREAGMFVRFLNMSVSIIDNVRYYDYNTEEYESVTKRYEKDSIAVKDINMLVESIKDAIRECNECLLDAEAVVLNPESVYVGEEGFYFMFNPENETGLQAGLKKLWEYVIEHIDYTDKEAVVYGYEIYRRLVKEGQSIETIVLHKPNIQEPDIQKLEKYTALPECMESNIELPKEKEEEGDNKKGLMAVIAGIIIILLAIGLKQVKVAVLIAAIIAVIYLVRRKPMKEKEPVTEPVYETVLLDSRDIRPRLIYEEKGEEKNAQITVSPYFIGTQKERVNLCVKSKSISRIHARIFSEGNNYYIEDMNSTNGTSVNDRKLRAHEILELKSMDIITMADMEFVFSI